MVGGNFWVKPLEEGKTIDEVGDALDGDLLGADPKAAWDRSADECIAAFKAPGAMEQTVHLSFGDFPGSDYCDQRFLDNLIHQWDVATATGGDTTLDPELVEAGIAWSEPMEEPMRSAGAIGPRPELPENPTRQALLLAMWGRAE